jgi:hypothetical protein
MPTFVSQNPTIGTVLEQKIPIGHYENEIHHPITIGSFFLGLSENKRCY